jgi:F-type H+-transporting ATPase subunit delta
LASVVSTYARAFVQVVVDENLDAARCLEGLRQIDSLLKQSVALSRVWENPAVRADQKRHLLDAIVQRGGMEKHVRNFVAVLIDHRRLRFLDRIIAQFVKDLDARLGFAEAQITSARELADPERQVLEAQVEKLTGKKVRASFALDPSLLGGAVVRVDSTIYDGSLKGQLQRIKQAISS